MGDRMSLTFKSISGAVFCVLAMACTWANAAVAQSEDTDAVTAGVELRVDSVERRIDHPVLSSGAQYYYRNLMSFTFGRETAGASGFFSMQDDAVVFVTAKHLLGDAMGLSPPVSVHPDGFYRELSAWTVLAPPNYDQVAALSGLTATSPDQNEDRIALEAFFLKDLGAEILGDFSPVDITVGVLSIAKGYPRRGDTLYLIGCPYAEDDCVQNTYRFTAVNRGRGGELVMDWVDPMVELAGFSGAPIVNANGEVVAVLSAVTDDQAFGQTVVNWL